MVQFTELLRKIQIDSVMKKAKMMCAKCGAEMNYHADKVDYDADDALSIDRPSMALSKKYIRVPTVAMLHRGRLDGELTHVEFKKGVR